MPADTEWTQTTTIRLPEEGQRVEVESLIKCQIYKALFSGGKYHTLLGTMMPCETMRWRPLPELPKPTLPDFVEAAIDKWMHDDSDAGIIPVFASCFAWPHDPPRPGDKKLVVETYHGAGQTGVVTRIQRFD